MFILTHELMQFMELKKNKKIRKNSSCCPTFLYFWRENNKKPSIVSTLEKGDVL
jgi:hypothetical protein